MKRMILRAAVAACGLLAMLSVAKAAPLDNRIPDDAVVYAGWAGADALAPAYQGSNLKGVIDNTRIGDYVRENWEKWMQQGHVDAENEKEINAGADAMKMLWRHPAAMYVGPMGLKDVKNPTFKIAFLFDAGADAGAIMDWHKQMMAKHPAPKESKMQAALDGTVVILTIGDVSPDEFMNKAGDRAGGRLPASANYIAAMKFMQKDPAIAVYVDAARIIATIQEVVEKAPDAPPEAKKATPEIIKALGLNGLTQLAMTGVFDKKQWSERGFVGTTGPRTGLLGLLDGAPVSDQALAMVPKDVGAMNIGRMDLMKVMAIVRDVIGKVDPKASAEFEKSLGEISRMSGLDIEKDVINAFGDEWITYRGPRTDEGEYPFAMVQKLRDAAGIAKALDVIEEKMNAATQGKMKIEKLDAGNFEVKGIRFPQMMAGTPSSIAWTIRNGVLYISTLEGMDAVVGQVEKKGESIAANEGYKAVRAELPQVKATMVSYNDPSKLYPVMYRMLMGVLPMARLVGLDIPEDPIPAPKTVAEFLTPSAAISWSDADGFHFASKSAFPGSELLSGQGSPRVAAVALGTAILLPSLGKARELANRSYSAANLRGIAQSAIIWSAEHNDALPDDVGQLILSNQISPKLLVSKRAGTAPLAVTPEMMDKANTDFAPFAKEVEAHDDYVYLGKGETNTMDSTVVMAYEKATPAVQDGINLAYMDAHVEFIRWAGLADAFKATNEYRDKLKLPPVDVDALVKAGKSN